MLRVMSWSSETTVRAKSSVNASDEHVATLRLLFTPEPLPDQRELVVLSDMAQIIGRDEAAALPLRDKRVSRSHASAFVRNGAIHVRDHDSANGLMVFGSRWENELVEDGTVLRIGDSFVVARWVSPRAPDLAIDDVVGSSPAIQALRAAIGRVAPTEAVVLVQGETGTGKELVANAIHARSGREGELVTVNCATIQPDLAESQLFGHVAGAFTGARAASKGFFQAASGGTLFLDEVGELPPPTQAKLLRALERREVVPLGGTKPVKVDIRVIAATHRPLLAGVDEGWFRGDLYARLSQLVLRTPPLRDRLEDVLPLLSLALDGDVRPLDPELVDALLSDRWRFNVRGLFKVARELQVHNDGAERLELRFVQSELEPRSAALEAKPTPEAPTREGLIALLERHRGNVRRVAEAASRSRKQIYRYLEKFELDPAEYRR